MRKLSDSLYACLVPLGVNISIARKVRKLTQRDLAAKTEISYRYLQGIEAGKINATLATVLRIATALGLSVCDLLDNRKKFDASVRK